MDTEEIIKAVFRQHGMEAKSFQLAALSSILADKDVFVSVPTGAGKTYAYCFLPSIVSRIDKTKFPIIVVLSPLVSLMVDQVNRFTALGLSASFVGEAQKCPVTLDKVIRGEFNIILMSPEAALQSNWRTLFSSAPYRKNLVAIIIDECHCVTEWYVNTC